MLAVRGQAFGVDHFDSAWVYNDLTDNDQLRAKFSMHLGDRSVSSREWLPQDTEQRADASLQPRHCRWLHIYYAFSKSPWAKKEAGNHPTMHHWWGNPRQFPIPRNLYPFRNKNDLFYMKNIKLLGQISCKNSNLGHQRYSGTSKNHDKKKFFKIWWKKWKLCVTFS